MSVEPSVATPPDASELTCVLCRGKKSSEALSKVCHVCGLPVHGSCAQQVAARDCGLGFGFPPPSVYCSKRCYEGDLLESNGSNAGSTSGDALFASGNAQNRWSAEVPNEISATLTLKIGDVTKTSRRQLCITSFQFLLTEGFDVFKAKVNSRTNKELSIFSGDVHIREDPAIYIRPGVHSKQAELVPLTEANFETRIRKTYRNFLKRKALQGPSAGQERFECDIFTYVKKESAIRRRGGPAKTFAGLTANAFQLPIHPPGRTAFSDYSDTSVGNSATQSATGDISTHIQSLSHLEAIGHCVLGAKRRIAQLTPGDLSEASEHPSAYKNIRMVLNGSVVAVKVNVFDLLSAIDGAIGVGIGDDAASNSTTQEAMNC
ncbi:hypothetical protein Poli38472_003988 [Pythium oligandrum]|uniref:Uncharacterized protein n=1 Tax=Pythium oligandrum TaxID=41045 RepID=A0A8K1FQ37_PYTOL|nr:hypothetical protein Poli38472_003988 [Pythium oligandrum]|eukprot:TMW66223.1 hypothetical protein Poli38472_003988 [Pythium oligandrum]